MCQRSQRLRRHDVSVDYADTVSADTCQGSHRLRGHRVSVVVDYADTREIILLWKKLTCEHTFFGNIFANAKNLAKPFLLVHIRPRWNF